MGNYEQLKQAVSDVIKTNGNQEITGSVLQNVLLTIISTIGTDSTFAGIATPDTNPGTPDQNVFYLATEPGTYNNFVDISLGNGEVAIITNNGGTWKKQLLNLITDDYTGSGYIYAGIVYPHSEAPSITYKHFFTSSTPGTYENFNNIQVDNGELVLILYDNGSYKKTTVQKINFCATSGGDADLSFVDDSGNVLFVIENGNIRTKNFQSDKSPFTDALKIIGDLAISDENGNIIMLLKDGHIFTKNWTSEDVQVKKLLGSGDFAISDAEGNIIMLLKDGHVFTKNWSSEDSNSGDSNLECFTDKDENGATSVNPITNNQWSGWSEDRYTFGFDSRQVPFHNSSFSVDEGTIICAGDVSKLRWGFHVFEGYANDKKSRITMLVNKHTEEGKALAELYYYLTVYNHSEKAYGYFKLGSDVKQHSFMFSRDVAISFGSHDFRNIIELASINPSTDLDSTYDNIDAADAAYEPESNAAANAKCVLYLALKNARDGAMWYDNARKKIVAKIDGKWCDIQTQEVPEDTYNF